MDKLIRDYNKILEAFAPLTKPAKEVCDSVSNITKSLEEFQKPLKETRKIADSTDLAKGLQPLIRTIQLNNLGIYSKDIARLVENGFLERVRQGYYRIVETTENDSEAKLIYTLYPDGIICMTSALFYYGYSDRTPLAWDIAIDRNVSKSRFNIDYPYVKPYYIDKAHLIYGVTDAKYEYFILQIFDRDRLICECIKNENKMDKEIYNKAIISYINDNSKNIAKLMEYAKKRNVHKKVRERMEMWL